MPYDKKQALAKQENDKMNKKTWTRKKTVAAVIIGAAVLSFIAFMVIVFVMQLGPVRPIKSNEEEARIVGECGGYDVRYEELRYVTLLHKASLDGELGDYDSLDAEGRAVYESELAARVTEDLKSNYTVLSLCDYYDIDTDSLDADNYVQDAIEALVENGEAFDGDKKAYKAWLAENNLTDSFLRLMYKVNYLETVLVDHFVENKINVEYDSENIAAFTDYVMTGNEWVRTVHVYYPAEHPWTKPGNVPAEILAVDPEYIEKIIDEYDAASAVQQAWSKICAESDKEARYSALRSAVGAAPVTEFSISGNGLYFTYGQMAEAYESCAFALELYGVSEIVELDEGYYIIMRLPLQEEDVKKNVNELLYQYQYAAVKKQLDAQNEKIEFVGNEYYQGISLIDIE
ncbi:MAG: hypothetical protein IJY39_11930 [Clostridia bacterium]|nr:hypothetical protein [Clostridia bacterium]